MNIPTTVFEMANALAVPFARVVVSEDIHAMHMNAAALMESVQRLIEVLSVHPDFDEDGPVLQQSALVKQEDDEEEEAAAAPDDLPNDVPHHPDLVGDAGPSRAEPAVAGPEGEEEEAAAAPDALPQNVPHHPNLVEEEEAAAAADDLPNDAPHHPDLGAAGPDAAVAEKPVEEQEEVAEAAGDVPPAVPHHPNLGDEEPDPAVAEQPVEGEGAAQAAPGDGHWFQAGRVYHSSQIMRNGTMIGVGPGYIGGHYYVAARSGRVYDSRNRPPDSCFNCGGDHWSIHCPFAVGNLPSAELIGRTRLSFVLTLHFVLVGSLGALAATHCLNVAPIN